jgi:hypothetical protein
MYLSFFNLYLVEDKTFQLTFEKYDTFVGIFWNFNNFFANTMDWKILNDRKSFVAN